MGLNVNESLHSAAWVGDFRAIKGLLQCPGSKFNVNTVDNRGRTLLYIVAMLGHLETVTVLLQNPDINVDIGKRINGGTAFSIASEKSHLHVLKALIVFGKSNESKGWYTDSWSKSCKKMEDLIVVNNASAALAPSGRRV